MNNEDIANILRQLDLVPDAQLASRNANAPTDFQIMDFILPYNTAVLETNPRVIGFPFRSFYVVKSTHPSLTLKLKPYTQDANQAALEISEKDAIDFGTQINKAYIHWDAQSVSGGSNIVQKVTILFSLTASFRPGAFSSVKGGVKTDVYPSFTCGQTNLAAGVATLVTSPSGLGLLGQDQSWLIQNTTGADIWVGDSGVNGTTSGIKISNGDSFKWNNRSDLYGYSVAGGNVMILREF